MKLLFLFLFLISRVLSENFTVYSKNHERFSRAISCGVVARDVGLIIDGITVKKGEFPWVASLMKRVDMRETKYFCGGVIVSSTKIVTAAHCLHPKNGQRKLEREVQILVGAYDLEDFNENGRFSTTPQKIFIHPSWNPFAKRFMGDIAVLIPEETLHFRRFVSPICMWNFDENPNPSTGSVVGYGKSEDQKKLHETIPRKIEVPILNLIDCHHRDSSFATISAANMFCAGSGDGRGVCSGDSGNGLIFKHNNKFYLMGIVSSSFIDDTRSCDVTRFALFTDVPKFKDWIDNPTENYGNNFAVETKTTSTSCLSDCGCTLPNGQQSKCVRVDDCQHFQDIIRKHNGRPPPSTTQDTQKYFCSTPRGTICCPGLEAGERSADSSSLIDTIKNHPNIKLVNDEKCGETQVDRVVGGAESQIKEFPWFALLGGLSRKDSQITWDCAGSLITSRFVLSTAHCVNKKEMKIVRIRLGEHTLSTDPDCDKSGACADKIQDVEVTKAIKHPEFSSLYKKNDIALIELASTANIHQNNINTICLPLYRQDDIEKVVERNVKLGIPLTLLGFNLIIDGFKYQDGEVLKKAFVPFVDYKSCNKYYETYALRFKITEKQFCAGSTKGFKRTTSCAGDSGVPITTLGISTNKPIIYGFVIAGPGCEADSKDTFIEPDIITDIRSYLPWILDNIEP